MRRRWTRHRSAQPQRGLPTAAGLIAAFAGLAIVNRLLCVDALGNSSFWPANAALVVAFLVLPRSLGLATAVACFCVNILINYLTAYLPSENLLFSALNIAMSLLAAVLTRALCGARADLSRFRRLTVFAVIAITAAAAEATLGCVLQAAPSLFADWFQWTLCDGLGLLLATPAILLSINSSEADLAADAGPAERALLLAATALLAVAAFAFAHTPLLLLLYPLLILTAFRAGPGLTLACVLVTSLVASAMTAHGMGPLVLLSPYGALLKEDMMQPYLVSLFLAAVPANNALGEKYRHARRLRRLKSAMEQDATHDALTGLSNRAAFRRKFAAALTAGSAEALLLVDLDRFKTVNDTMGHQAGDELLRAFGLRLANIVGDGVMAARLGGDEFAVLVADTGHMVDPEALGETIAAIARQPFSLLGRIARVSACIGGVVIGDADLTVDETMRRADMALYTAKANGRDGTRFFSEALDEAVRDEAALVLDLRDALGGGGGLVLHYQPKLDRNGVPAGVEALIRWHHPRRGFLRPQDFIALAESTGLIIPLGAWVLDQALAFAQRWPQLKVALNVSPVQLRHPTFVEDTIAAFRRSGLPPGQIELELTETALVDAAEAAEAALAALREEGLHIALDDFGTGYSSLNHLQRFRVDRVKIDRSFVMGLMPEPGTLQPRGARPTTRGADAIVKAVIDLGHAMGLMVTAEGVETKSQRDFLLKAGADELQGYLFAKPMDEAALGKALSAATFARVAA